MTFKFGGGSGGGGGGGGAGTLLGYAYSETPSSSLNISSFAAIPNTEITFALTETTDVLLSWSQMCNRSSGGNAHITPQIDGTLYQPISVNQCWTTYSTENNTGFSTAEIIVSLAAGEHTIQMMASDEAVVSPTVFWSRYLSAIGLGPTGG